LTSAMPIPPWFGSLVRVPDYIQTLLSMKPD